MDVIEGKPHHKNEFSECYVHRCVYAGCVGVDGLMRLAIGLKIFPVVSGDGLVSCSQSDDVNSFKISLQKYLIIFGFSHYTQLGSFGINF